MAYVDHKQNCAYDDHAHLLKVESAHRNPKLGVYRFSEHKIECSESCHGGDIHERHEEPSDDGFHKEDGTGKDKNLFAIPTCDGFGSAENDADEHKGHEHPSARHGNFGDEVRTKFQLLLDRAFEEYAIDSPITGQCLLIVTWFW